MKITTVLAAATITTTVFGFGLMVLPSRAAAQTSPSSDRQAEFGRFPSRPFDYMRHPAAGVHWDGALDEEVLVAISGYGPTSAKVVDGGELFGRVRPAR
jgi:hypothetical protein